MNHSPSSAQSELPPESPEAFALRMLVAGGLVSQAKVDSALSVAAKFRAHDNASAQTTPDDDCKCRRLGDWKGAHHPLCDAATPPSPDANAHTIGEDAANVAIGEREALLADHIELNMCNYDPDDVALLNAWAIRAYDFIDRATLTAEKVAGESSDCIKLIRPNTGDEFRALRTDSYGIAELLKEGWQIAPQQPSQPVAQPAEQAAEPLQGMELAFSSDAMSRRDELDLPGATTYIDRFVDALGLLCRSKPSKAMCEQWLNGESEDLQSWAVSNARIYWQMGIGTIEAAQHLADNPEEGEGHEGFTADYADRDAQPVAQTLALTDEQREAIEYAVRWMDENVSNRYAHTAAKELRALLAAQPASSLAEGGES